MNFVIGVGKKSSATVTMVSCILPTDADKSTACSLSIAQAATVVLLLQTIGMAVSTLALLLLLPALTPSRWCAAADGGGVVAGGQLWCVAKNNAEDDALQAALDWACGPGGADCGPVQEGGACYDPADIQDHASYAFNNYFLRHDSAPDACDFSGTAALTSLDPSQGKCSFPSSGSANGGFSGSSTAAGDGVSGGARLRPEMWCWSLMVAFVASGVFQSGMFWQMVALIMTFVR